MTSSGENLHATAIDEMARTNGQSLPISYLHLSHHSPVLAIWLADVPKRMLDIFDSVAMDAVLARWPEYSTIQDEVHVRITQLPIADSLRDLRHSHLNALIKVTGVVTRRTGVFPQLKLIRFNCAKCSNLVGPFVSNEATEVKPVSCPECQGSGPFILNQEETLYRNYQKLTLQETPGSVPAGRVPRSKDVVLLSDLIDSVRGRGPRCGMPGAKGGRSLYCISAAALLRSRVSSRHPHLPATPLPTPLPLVRRLARARRWR